MGRTPCCEADQELKRGPWTPEEDQKLLAYIQQHGHGSWRFLPQKAGLQRCGKSCRLRWINYLRPDIKRGKFSLQEERTIIQLHALLGNRWSAIATHLPKRTDNDIKNYWNIHLKKKLAMMGIDPTTHMPQRNTLSSPAADPKNFSNLSHIAQWESTRLEAEARLVRESKLKRQAVHHGAADERFTEEDHQTLSFEKILKKMPTTFALPRCPDILKAWQQGRDRLFSTTSMQGSDHNRNAGRTSTGGLCNSPLVPGNYDNIEADGSVNFIENTFSTVFEECGGDGNSGGDCTRLDEALDTRRLEGVEGAEWIEEENLIEGSCDHLYAVGNSYWNDVLDSENCGPSNLSVF